MIRPFGLSDSLLVRSLQSQGVQLDMDQALVRARSPLWTALMAPLLWPVNGIATYVLRARVHNEQLSGFIQIQKRPDRSEADLVFLSPDLGIEGASETWRRLLHYCCQKAADNGVQRLYASLPDDAEGLGLFRNAGFSLYAREELFRLIPLAAHNEPPADDIQMLRKADHWQLKRFYTQYTPQLVQLAEGAMGGENKPPFLTDVEWASVQSYALVKGGEISGVVQVLSGRDGHLLRLWGDTMNSAYMARLLNWGIAVASRRSLQPVYCTVRDYQGGLQPLLEELGFEHVGRRVRLVKYIMRTERVLVTSATPVLDPRTEVITTVSGLEARADGAQIEQPVPTCTDEQPASVVMAELH